MLKFNANQGNDNCFGRIKKLYPHSGYCFSRSGSMASKERFFNANFL